MKTIHLLLAILCMTTLSFATVPAISLSAGSATFSENFDSGVALKGSVEFIAPSGIGLSGSLGLIRADASNDELDELLMVPVLAGATYHFFAPRRSVVPYVGASAGVGFLANGYDSTVMLYGGKVGFLIRTRQHTSFFLEADYLSGSDDAFDVDIQPLSFNFGVKLIFPKQKIGRNPQDAPMNRKPKPRDRRGFGRPRL